MKHLILSALILLGNILSADAQNLSEWETLQGKLNLVVLSDMGRNGYYEQKKVAQTVGEVAEIVDAECVVAAGDTHHWGGVRSVNDPLWLTNYELIYSHPSLMTDWFPILGNHEYRGNTQAVLDYSAVSRRWNMPARYYTRVVRDDEVSLRLIFLDTAPLIDKYRRDPETYPDACRQDLDAQLSWLDKTLKEAREDWIVCIGHHPIYADTSKDTAERADLQRRLQPVLRRYGNVDAYICGHIHNFQHIEMPGDDISYIVCSSASKAREKVTPISGTRFCSGVEGFMVIASDRDTLHLHMVNASGRVINTITRHR